jgi:hypothetical protein
MILLYVRDSWLCKLLRGDYESVKHTEQICDISEGMKKGERVCPVMMIASRYAHWPSFHLDALQCITTPGYISRFD